VPKLILVGSSNQFGDLQPQKVSPYLYFGEQTWNLFWSGDHVIVPPHLLDEIKNKKEDEVDNIAALDAVSNFSSLKHRLLINMYQLTERKLTGIESTSPMMNHLVKSDLTSSLSMAHCW